MDELLGRQVPQSLEAEQAVLGSILIDSRCVADVIGLLKPDDFYLSQNKDIFETIYSMFNFSQVIDPVTVLDKMKERGIFDEKTSVQYVMQLMEITPTAANVLQYAQIVRDKALLRSIAQAAGEIGETVYEGVGTAQDILEACLLYTSTSSCSGRCPCQETSWSPRYHSGSRQRTHGTGQTGRRNPWRP